LSNPQIQENQLYLQKKFLLIFYLVIIEGSIRKWFANSLGIPILVIRDIIVLTTIYYGLQHKIFNFDKQIEKFVLLWTILVSVWIVFQLIFKDNLIQIYLIGFRNWVLYIWFTLICFRVLNHSSLINLSKHIILTIIPLAILSIIQHLLPVDHFLNSLPKDGYIFQVVPGIVRTTSTFSHVYGYTQYIMFVCPLVYILIINIKTFNISKKISILVIFLFFVAIATSGSRGSILYSIIMLLPLLVTRINLRIQKTNIFLNFIGIVFIGLAIWYFFPMAIEATSQRFAVAGQNEDTTNRMIRTFFGSAETWDNLTLIGNGIGLGSNSARVILGLDGVFTLGEFESDRVINEGGVLGIFFILIKFITVYFLILSYKKLKREQEPYAFLYWSYLLIHIFSSQITGQITSHAFTYLALGIGFAFLKNDQKKKQIKL